MFYEHDKRDKSLLPYDHFKAVVAPPIGWITSISAKGEVNLAPYSYFNGVNNQPNVVMFASEGRKDSLAFIEIEETGEFFCNLATWDLREQMNATSALLARGINEMERAGLKSAPLVLVKPPRVAASPWALECKLIKIVPIEIDGQPLDCHVVFRSCRRRPYRGPLHRRRPARHRRHTADRALRRRPICGGAAGLLDDPPHRLNLCGPGGV